MASLAKISEIQRAQELERRAREFPPTELDARIEDLKENLSWSTRAFNVDDALKARETLEEAYSKIREDVKRSARVGVSKSPRLAISVEIERKRLSIDRALWDSILSLANEAVSRYDFASAQKVMDVVWVTERFPNNPKEHDRVEKDLMKLAVFLEGAPKIELEEKKKEEEKGKKGSIF